MVYPYIFAKYWRSATPDVNTGLTWFS